MFSAISLTICLLLAGCQTVSKSTFSVSATVAAKEPEAYVVMLFETAPTPKGRSYSQCYPETAETITTMVIAGMTEIVPYVIDGRKMGAMKAFRSLLDHELEDAGNEMVDELLDADVVDPAISRSITRLS